MVHTKFSGVLALFTIIQAAGWPIWPLLICSIVALALVIERMMSLRTHLVAPEGLLEQALKASQNNLPSEEAMEQLHDNSVLGRVLASGLHAMKDEPLISSEDLHSSMESAGRKAAHELEKYLVALATIATSSADMYLAMPSRLALAALCRSWSRDEASKTPRRNVPGT